jgi:predicted GH43/DUF377 family glycosyl hydrolase
MDMWLSWLLRSRDLAPLDNLMSSIIATSTDLLNWKRFEHNPIVPVRKGGYDSRLCSDGKVFRDGDHWVMFYFGVNMKAHIMAAFSRDLIHWTAHPKPLYKAGG